jgi:hypothetical protein
MIKLIDAPHEFFLDDPALCLQGLPDCDLYSLKEVKKLTDRPSSQWFGVYGPDEVMIAVVRMEPHTDTSVITHLYIATQFQQLKLLKYIFVDIVNYLKEHTPYTSITVATPHVCEHVIRTMKPLGFVLEGRIPQKLMWRNKRVDLLYYKRKI